MLEALDAPGAQWERRIQILGELVSQAKEFRLYHFTFFFFFLVMLRSMQDLSSLTRDQTQTPCSGSMES